MAEYIKCFCSFPQKDGKILPWVKMTNIREMELFDLYANQICRLMIAFHQGILVKKFPEFFFKHTNTNLEIGQINFSRLEDFLYHLAVMPVMLLEFRVDQNFELHVLLHEFSVKNPMKSRQRNEFLYGKKLISPMEFLCGTGGCDLMCLANQFRTSPPISRMSRCGNPYNGLMATPPPVPYEVAFPELWPKSNYYNYAPYHRGQTFHFPRHHQPSPFMHNSLSFDLPLRPPPQPMLTFTNIHFYARFQSPNSQINGFHKSRFPAQPVEQPAPMVNKFPMANKNFAHPAKVFQEKVNSALAEGKKVDPQVKILTKTETNTEPKTETKTEKKIEPIEIPERNVETPTKGIPPLMSICLNNVALTSIYEKSRISPILPQPLMKLKTEVKKNISPTADFEPDLKGENVNFPSMRSIEILSDQISAQITKPSLIPTIGSIQKLSQKMEKYCDSSREENSEIFKPESADVKHKTKEENQAIEEELLFEQIPGNSTPTSSSSSETAIKPATNWIEEMKNEDIIEKFMKTLEIEGSPSQFDRSNHLQEPEISSSQLEEEIEDDDSEPPLTWFSAKLKRIDEEGFIYFPYKKTEHKGQIFGMDFFSGTKVIAAGMKGIGKSENSYLTLRRTIQSSRVPIYELEGIASKDLKNENAQTLLNYILQNARPKINDSKSETLCYAEDSRVFIQNKMYLNAVNQWIAKRHDQIAKLEGETVTYQNVLYLVLDAKKKNYYRTYILNEDQGKVNLYLIDIGVIISVPTRVVIFIQMDRYPELFPPLIIELDSLAKGVDLFGIKEILDVEFVNREIKKINPKMKVHRVLNRLQAEFFIEQNGQIVSVNQKFVEDGKAK